ncbi:DUF771 domain-containing protein [Streptococcus parauberis]|uniref:DUF771 domain-containing protein n=1 Tax=Streptococcus parauberis NCFD 2020 TaxID=873447 RepID=F1Z2J3_9STRE|nr:MULTISPECIES: DUF771 domain-containing protein [Streptococcus]WHL24077.1 DUF771 domain-containing protein [Streptococcus iniae]EGE53065.1 hypothetical protein SPB_1061 [Streptococcus parauberis NCFD 2020]KYP21155.1 hypothetical protein AKL13_00778 [Streptococcus parauberis]KYP21539.1 hypothetical protein TN39_00701 [Streptococcus parauberis]KYP22065.1 hypothetical protein AKL14_00061 [Streptococcus parauberis]
MQQVFNVSVPIPDDVVVISKEEYLELLSDNEQGKWWGIEDVTKLLDISKTKLINDILLNPDLKSEIDVAKNSKGFVVYPKNKGCPYKFLATRTRKYFEENFTTILLREKML